MQDEQETIAGAIKKTESRLAEIRTYRELLIDESSRLQRAQQAGNLLADLKVTHCPACDRRLTQSNPAGDLCYLCRRPLLESTGDSKQAKKRLEFEIGQLSGELTEADRLVATLERDLERLFSNRESTAESIDRVRGVLRPVRAAAAAILPTDIAVSDIETGQLQERIRQLERIKASLHRRETLSAEINTIQQEVAILESEVAEQGKNIDFEQAGDLFGDAMNTYLNQLNQAIPGCWSQDPVAVHFKERSFNMRVSKSPWRAKLGGTLTLYFLLAYHHALMSLSNRTGFNYPGLVILDFPAELETGELIADKENFVLEPFVELLSHSGAEETQVIAAGSSFANLQGANRIKLVHVWK